MNEKTIQEKLISCKYDNKVIECALPLENRSGFKLVFNQDDVKNEIISMYTAIDIIENNLHFKNVESNSDGSIITILNDNGSKLFIQNYKIFRRVFLSPSSHEDLAVEVFNPIDLLTFLERVNEKVNLTKVYKEMCEEHYKKEIK